MSEGMATDAESALIDYAKKLSAKLDAVTAERDEALAKLEQTQRAMDAYATRCDELSVRLRQSEELLLANEEADEDAPDWDRYWGSQE